MKDKNEKRIELQLFAEEAQEVSEAPGTESAAGETSAVEEESGGVITPEEYAAMAEAPEEPEGDEGADENEPPREDAAENPLEERLRKLEESIARQNDSLRKMENTSFLRSHFAGLERQSAALRERIPDFDLAKELKNTEFVRLTSPRIGLSVEDAYYALHHAQLEKNAAESAAMALGNSIRAGQSMPVENGGSGISAGGSGYRSYKDLSPEERAIRKEMIMSGKLRF